MNFTNKFRKYEPISYVYFLNMELAQGGGGKEIITQNGKLKYVKDVIEFFQNQNNLDKAISELKPNNWQYFNCMMAGFRHNVADHHELGWENLTKEYFDSLNLMNENEIDNMLKNNPVGFQNGFIKHGYHRAVAMIGRLIRNESYIPFYMETAQIFNQSTKHDNVHRLHHPTKFIKGLSELDDMGIDKSEYSLTQSSILTIMGIRQNDDLDIIISSKLRDKINKGNGNFKLSNVVDVFPKDYDKFKIFGCQSDDDAINNFSLKIGDYNFLEPRFYFSRKHKDKKQRDIDDWIGINTFFKLRINECYPFNQISLKQFGVDYL